jgi:predicted acyltransferase
LHWRILGVLQRIGLAYTVAALLTLRTTVRQQIVILASILFGYWIVMTVLPVPGEGTIGALLLDEPSRTMAAWVDRLVLDWSRVGLGNHLWASSVTWDPEGVLSTIPAIGTAMLGNLAGRWIGEKRPLSERLAGLSSVGELGKKTGHIWHSSIQINKSLMTRYYVLFSAGVAAVALSTVMWIVDFNRVRRFTKLFVVYGTNPIVAFVGSAVMARCLYSIFKVNYAGTRIPLQEGIYRTLFASWLSPVNASLAFAVAFVLFWYGVLSLLHRRGIILKV